MNRSRLLPLLLPSLLAVVGCDRGSAAPSSPSETVAIAPRLLAASPLGGTRVQLDLVSGDVTIATIDTAYVPGRRLILGTVPTGDSFAVFVRGYDESDDGFRQIVWAGIVRSLASTSVASVMPVDIPVDTTAPAEVDTADADDPTSIEIPKGCWYTTDGSDPRVSDSGGSVHVSDDDRIPKTGIVLVVSRKNSAIEGEFIWSPVQRWNFDSLSSPMRTLLEGVWWEDDTTASGKRLIFLDTLNGDGTFHSVGYHPVRMTPISDAKGTWVVSGEHLRLTLESGSYDEYQLTARGSGFALHNSGTGMRGSLSRTRPAASPATDPVRFSLVGAWFETLTQPNGEVSHFLDTLRADSTLVWRSCDADMVPTGDRNVGVWSADSIGFRYVNSGSSDVYGGDLYALADTGFRVEYASGAVSIYRRIVASTDTLRDPTAMAALSGTWWFDTLLASANSTLYPVWFRYDLDADGTFRRTLFLTPHDSAQDTTRVKTWGASAGSIRFTLGDSTIVTRYAHSSGTLRLLDGSGDSLTRTTASMEPAELLGTWIKDENNAIEFTSGGAVTWYYNGAFYSYTDWSAHEGTFYLYATVSGTTSLDASAYSVSGNTLTLTGTFAGTYTKQ